VFFEVEAEAFAWFGTGGLLMVLSLLVVIAGIALAWGMYVRDARLPTELAERVPWAYRVSFNKFYMDQLYEISVIRPVIDGANWLWVFFDVKVIDGAVNGLAKVWGLFGAALRPLQTGRAQNYAMGIFAGLFVLVVVFRWVWGG
jgi:NADH-quinone oxidoreductase subunit L